jgi:hypothetical protein
MPAEKGSNSTYIFLVKSTVLGKDCIVVFDLTISDNHMNFLEVQDADNPSDDGK